MSSKSNIIVVTGLARSGTTCMMRMLEAGGVPLYYDRDKPLAFSENGIDFVNFSILLRETKLSELDTGNAKWLENCYGETVKILRPANGRIPKGHRYKFIYMDRKTKHMAKSQQKFIIRARKQKMPIKDVVVDRIDQERRDGIALLKRYPESSLMVVRFEDLIQKTESVAVKVNRFLGLDLNIEGMVDVVIDRPIACHKEMLEEQIYM